MFWPNTWSTSEPWFWLKTFSVMCEAAVFNFRNTYSARSYKLQPRTNIPLFKNILQKILILNFYSIHYLTAIPRYCQCVKLEFNKRHLGLPNWPLLTGHISKTTDHSFQRLFYSLLSKKKTQNKTNNRTIDCTAILCFVFLWGFHILSKLSSMNCVSWGHCDHFTQG